MIAAAISLFKSQGKPVKGRVIRAFLAPVMVGILVHSFNGSDEIISAEALIDEGMNGNGGGLVSGAIGALLIEGISRIATIVVALFLTVLITFGSFKIKITDFVKPTPVTVSIPNR